jgi:hypothetical protein
MSNASAITQKISECQSAQIAAYLDGELCASAAISFEAHVGACAVCAEGLRAHQQLLRLLESELENSFAAPLPKNFARIVAARAQSDMSGARARSEHKRALWLCAPLVALCSVLLGLSGGERVIGSASALIKHAASILFMLSRWLYDVGAGFAVIFRALGRNFIFESRSMNLLAVLLLAFILGLLSRLITIYHQRTQVMD